MSEVKRGAVPNIAYMGLCLALALILGYVESLIPFNFGIPGIKLGLPNLCVVVLLYICGYKEAFAVDMLRVILNGFLFGNMSMLIYSLVGALISFICMSAAYRSKKLKAMGVSLVGGVTHNIGQLIVACFALGSLRVVYYVPALIISGAITGALLGFIAGMIVPTLQKYNNSTPNQTRDAAE